MTTDNKSPKPQIKPSWKRNKFLQLKNSLMKQSFSIFAYFGCQPLRNSCHASEGFPERCEQFLDVVAVPALNLPHRVQWTDRGEWPPRSFTSRESRGSIFTNYYHCRRYIFRNYYDWSRYIFCVFCVFLEKIIKEVGFWN